MHEVRRLACYGWVAEHAGSVASAGHAVLEELLRRGIRVDLFAHRDHVPEPPKLRGEGLRYEGFPQPRWLDGVDRLPGGATSAVRRLLYPLVAASWRRALEPRARELHRRDPYDAVLLLGTVPVFGVPGVPVVTWLQSPFHTELEAIRRLREPIVAAGGRPLYAGLVAWYRYYELLLRRNPVRSDRLIVGSEWSRRAMLDRLGGGWKIEALPYPIDLGTFSPEPPAGIDWESPLLLSAGRLDPRKRIDLLAEALPLVRRELPGARLLVVGRPGSVPSRLPPLDGVPGLEHRPQVPRADMPALLRQAAVVVQPSENENFGSTVAEALACGTPVVVGPSNGTADYIDDASRVFDSYAPAALARAIVDVARNRRERPEEVRTSTRAAAERWFAADRVADRLLETISSAIAERRLAQR